MKLPFLLTALCSLAFAQNEWLASFRIDNEGHTQDLKLGVYLVTFDDLSERLGKEQILGFPFENLVLYTNPWDTTAHVPQENLPSRGDLLIEVPLTRVDANKNGLFDSGDHIEFWGHGTALWKPQNNEQFAEANHQYFFSSSPYSNAQHYYFGYSTKKGKTFINLDVEGAATSVTNFRRYQRVEKDSLLYDNYFFEGNYDGQTGKQWFWKWYPKETEVVLSGVELAGHGEVVLGENSRMQLGFLPQRSNRWDGYKASASTYQERVEYLDPVTSYGGVFLEEEIGAFGVPRGGKIFKNLPKGTLDFSALEIFDGKAHARSGKRFDGLSFSSEFPLSQARDELYLTSLPNALIQWSGLAKGTEVFRIEKGVALGKVLKDSTALDRMHYFHHPSAKKRTPTIEPMVFASGVLDNLWEGKLGAKRVDPKYLILTPREFVNEALELKNFRTNEAFQKVATEVVLVEDIFREFGGWMNPVAIRDFLRQAKYNWAKDLNFVLLFGDGNYDYRNVHGKGVKNWVPPYEREDSSTDDFYVYLDAGEEAIWWSGLSPKPDLAIGRLPIQKVEHAKDYLNKIRNYEEKGSLDLSAWRNASLMMADDFLQLSDLDNIDHIGASESLTETLREYWPAMDFQKVFLADYEKDLSFNKPGAKRDAISAINEGKLFSTYFGHGGTNVLADENLLDDNAIPLFTNLQRLTIFGAFSCVVGRWDRDDGQSFSEKLVMHPQGGSIASISALRDSYSNQNKLMAQAFFRKLLNQDSLNTIGEALREAKYELAEEVHFRRNSEKYHLLGEPVLPVIHRNVEVRFGQVPDTLQALGKIEISGEVPGVNRGKVFLKVREQSLQRTWSETGVDASGAPKTLTGSAMLAGRTLYSEILEVQNGTFATEFVTPKKLSFGDSNAVLSAYVWNEEEFEVGAARKEGIHIWGTSSYADSINDNLPPEIKVYSCRDDESKTAFSEKLELSLPACLHVEVTDSTGLDYVENPDEGISWEVPGISMQQHPRFLSQSGRQASFRIHFGENVKLGEYDLKIRAMDVLGNTLLKELELTFVEPLSGSLLNVYNKPNPMKSSTVFHFEGQSGAMTEGTVRIWNQKGMLVKVLKRVKPGITQWNGRDEWGNQLANGLYYYKVYLEHLYTEELSGVEERRSLSRLQKLVISR